MHKEQGNWRLLATNILNQRFSCFQLKFLINFKRIGSSTFIKRTSHSLFFMVTNCWTRRTAKVIIRREVLRRKKFMEIKNTHGDFTSTPRFNLNVVVIFLFFFFGHLRRSSTLANSVFLILVINLARCYFYNCFLNKNSLTTIAPKKCLSIYFLMLDKFWLPVFK